MRRRGLRSLIACAAAGSLLLAACGGDDDSDAADDAATTTVADGAASDGPCSTTVPEIGERPEVAAPTETLDPAKTYTVVMQTSCGEITIELDAANAPVGAGNFAHLVKSGFYDGLTFHRVVPGFVVQGGDPEGTGAGGAGYDVVTEAPVAGAYVTGDVAWAKTAADPPGTASSQFFIMTGDDTGLPPDYGYAGRVTAGIEAALAMEMLSPAGDAPTQPIYIERAELIES